MNRTGRPNREPLDRRHDALLVMLVAIPAVSAFLLGVFGIAQTAESLLTYAAGFVAGACIVLLGLVLEARRARRAALTDRAS
jgi:hypothetical protein